MSGILDFFKAVAGICETRELSPHLWSLEEGTIRIHLDRVAELQRDGGSVYLKGKGLKHPVLIIRDEADRFLAFTNRCTHFGQRRLDPVPRRREISCCSVSHSTYDYDGKRLRGPARRPLTRSNVECVDGALVVDVLYQSARVD